MTDRAKICLIVNSQPGELRAGLTRDGELVDVLIHRDSKEPGPGDIYQGRVRRVVKAMKAAFVDLGTGPDGFLPLKGGVTATEGDYLLVQVRAPARDDKGPVLTARPNLAGPRLILTVGASGLKPSKSLPKQARSQALAALEGRETDEDGFILRRSSLVTGEDDLRAEAVRLTEQWLRVQEEASGGKGSRRLLSSDPLADLISAFLSQGGGADGLIADDPVIASHLGALAGMAPKVSNPKAGLFEAHGLEEKLEAALSPVVPLPSGGSLVLEQTAAVLAVDVNSGGGLKTGTEVVRITNTEAMRALAAQIRLRGLSGHVVVDGLSLEKRPVGSPALQTFKAALAREEVQADIGGITSQGLMEFTLRRTRSSLGSLCGPGNATARAFRLLRQAQSLGIDHPAGGRICLRAPSATVEDLRRGQSAAFRAQIEERLAITIALEEAEPVSTQEVRYER
ncbi:MAG: ribonuclease E/G [Magnetovibrionaceae bacterium]